MFYLNVFFAWTNISANNGDADDMKRYRAYYDVIVMGNILALSDSFDRML